MLTFESFRDLVRLMKLHVPEEVGILMAEDENIAMRAAAKSDAAGAAGGADSRQNTMAAAGQILQLKLHLSKKAQPIDCSMDFWTALTLSYILGQKKSGFVMVVARLALVAKSNCRHAVSKAVSEPVLCITRWPGSMTLMFSQAVWPCGELQCLMADTGGTIPCAQALKCCRRPPTGFHIMTLCFSAWKSQCYIVCQQILCMHCCWCCWCSGLELMAQLEKN